MPVMDGLEATRQIRALEREKSLPPIPIIGTSGNSSQAQKKVAKEAGMTGYLTKPFLKEEIARLIRTQTASSNPPKTEPLGTRRLPSQLQVSRPFEPFIELIGEAGDRKILSDIPSATTVPGLVGNVSTPIPPSIPTVNAAAFQSSISATLQAPSNSIFARTCEYQR